MNSDNSAVVHSVKAKLANVDAEHEDQPLAKKTKTDDLLEEEKTENSSIANWDIVPNEIRLLIVGFMSDSTKEVFQLCSKNCYELVEKDDRTVLDRVTIRLHGGFEVSASRFYIKHKPFETAQKLITRVFKYKNINVGSLEFLSINIDELTTFFKCIGGKINVERLVFEVEGITESSDSNLLINALKQVNLSDLNEVRIKMDFLWPHVWHFQEIYDLPQIRLPKTLTIKTYTTIRDDQLLKLNANHLVIAEAVCLTRRGVAAFLKKCLNELNTKRFDIKITFTAPRDEVLLEGFDISEEVLPERQLTYYDRLANRWRWDDDDVESSWIVNSPYPEHCLHVYERRLGDGNVFRVEATRDGEEIEW